MTRARKRALMALTVLGLCLGMLRLVPLPPVLDHGRGAVRVEDRTGALLLEPKGEDGLRADWVELERVPPALTAALVHGEDHHLGLHPGVDPSALVRALWLNAREQRLVSGASTLAMQLARLGYDLPRSLPGKLAQLVLAPFLTFRLGSHGVLEAYVNLAPFGRDVRGAAAASRAYFGKPLRDLTVGEQVALAFPLRSLPSSAAPPGTARARALADGGTRSPHARTGERRSWRKARARTLRAHLSCAARFGPGHA